MVSVLFIDNIVGKRRNREIVLGIDTCSLQFRSVATLGQQNGNEYSRQKN